MLNMFRSASPTVQALAHRKMLRSMHLDCTVNAIDLPISEACGSS